MNCLYTIPLCNFGFAFRHATCVIVKDFGKALLKTKSSPIFFSYKLSERKPLFQECQECPGTYVKPYRIEKLRCSRCGKREGCTCDRDDKHVDPNKPHRSDLCERCKSGKSCSYA